MCGICGVLGRADLDAAAIPTMVAALRHRGPDGRGVARVALGRGRVLHLGHARLAVLDPTEAGRQPMADSARGNWIVFNGEVYNHVELRRELESAGECFGSRTDTEVVLKAYGRWGPAALGRFRGMFAFAVWDSARRCLVLVRDRLGLKPLYHAWSPRGDFVFASEIRALLAAGVVPRRIDDVGLGVYLWNGFSIAPRTLVEGVRSLRPGTLLTMGADGRIREERGYWSPPSVPAPGQDRRAALAELRERFGEAVRLRLRSDVPLGAFLSGGLDSSAIVAAMVREGVPVRSFSVTFDEPRFDESRYARALAAAAPHQHTEWRLTRERFLRDLPAALASFDQPSFDGLNSYFVSRAARDAGLTVALSGLGADELFGGYPMFAQAPRLLRVSRWLGKLPPRLREWLGPRFDGASVRGVAPQNGRGKLIELLAGSPLCATRAYQLVNALLRPALIRELRAGRDAQEAAWGLPLGFEVDLGGDDDVPAAECLTRLCLRLFLGERCLRDADTTSMASSLEVRAPFTDHLFVEAALRRPALERTAGPPHKRFEAELFRGLVPELIRRRAKQGFVFPLARWLAEDLAPPVEETLLDGRLVRDVGLEPAPVRRLWAAFRHGSRAVPWSRVWALFMLLHWCRSHGVTAGKDSS